MKLVSKITKPEILIKTIIISLLIISFPIGCNTSEDPEGKKDHSFVTLSKGALKDKIKGAWAAQTIGVTFGGPVEFRFQSTLIQDYQQLDWNDSSLINAYENGPGLYDDIYLDLTFMEVIEKLGIDAPAIEFANAVARADYKLWFANQTARYNVLHGLTPPESGHWLNNPCADDIDFQIEADFAGIMAPGMVNSAVGICDKVGHIMNYGDGYYGGVFVASMYSLALLSNTPDNIPSIIKEALRVIPKESKFAQCIQDVITWYEQDPKDWKSTWFKTSRKWNEDIGSPIGVFNPFNIDAKINAAWVTIGLLYGKGDFTRTFEIATRCGDDADCNPATAGGILGAILGFDAIPPYWTQGLERVEALPFMGTSLSLIDAYDLSYQHAEKMIIKNGGEVIGTELRIPIQDPKEIPLEISFEGHFPTDKIVPKFKENIISFEFEGIGFGMTGETRKVSEEQDHIFRTEMYIDGELVEEVKLPTALNQRRFTPFFKYQLPRGKHQVQIKITNPVDFASVNPGYVIVYGDQPLKVNY